MIPKYHIFEGYWVSDTSLGTEYIIIVSYTCVWASLVAQLVKNPPAMQKDRGLIPGFGRSPGERNGYPLHYSGLENSMDCIVHAVAKSWTQLQLSVHTCVCVCVCKSYDYHNIYFK